jgi:hypothetical protein
MRIFLGITMGFISALILALIGEMTFGGKGAAAGGLAILGFVIGWPLSSWLFMRKAPTPARVASRAFLFGAIEWIVVIFAGWLMVVQTNARLASGPRGGYSAIASGAMAESGTNMAFIVVGSLICSGICLIGYFITRGIVKRETHVPLPETNE